MKRLHFLLYACALSLAVLTPATSFALTFYTDRPTFNLANPGLPIEDFEEGNVGAGGVISFDGPLDSTSNNTGFMPGDILPGISFVASTTDLALTGDGFLGIPTKAIGPNSFGDTFDILFTTPVLAAGMDVLTPLNASVVTASVFGEGNVLLGSTMINASATPTFFGVSNMAAITRINLDAEANGGEIIDNIAFGSPGNGQAPIPEPSTIVLLGSGLAGLIGYRMRKPQV